MSRRPTLTAVATAAGVSTATVDRVLNSRLPVREATAMRIIEAAERIGYHAAPLMRARLQERSEQRIRTFGFGLLRCHAPFYQAFAQALNKAAAQAEMPTVAVIEYLDVQEPAAIAERMLALGQEVDAMAVVAVDHPHINAAIETLHGQQCPVFTLLSDLSSPWRAGYVGVDPRKSGRTAAWAVSRLSRAPGPVGVFVGSHRYQGHEACEMSFRAYLREHAPAFQVLETQVTLEDTQIAYEATLTLLRRHPDLVGVYDAGGGGVAGIIRALREERPSLVPPAPSIAPSIAPSAAGSAQQPPHVVMVCNELTPLHRLGLIDGVVDMVMATPQARIAQTVVAAMHQALDRPTPPMQAMQMTVPFELFTAENV